MGHFSEGKVIHPSSQSSPHNRQCIRCAWKLPIKPMLCYFTHAVILIHHCNSDMTGLVWIFDLDCRAICLKMIEGPATAYSLSQIAGVPGSGCRPVRIGPGCMLAVSSFSSFEWNSFLFTSSHEHELSPEWPKPWRPIGFRFKSHRS